MVFPTFLAWLFHWTDSHHCTLSAAIQAQRPLSSYLSHPPHPHDCPRHLAPPQPRPSSAPSWSWQPTTHPAHALFAASWTADASSLFPRSSSAPPADSDSCCSTRPASALASTTATLRLVVLVRVYWQGPWVVGRVVVAFVPSLLWWACVWPCACLGNCESSSLWWRFALCFLRQVDCL